MINTSVPIFKFSIKNTSENEVDIYIDGAIVDASTQKFYEYFGDDTTTSFKSFREELNKIDVKTYNVYVNSPGGMVTEAMAIHDLLRDKQNSGKTVNTIGRGIIASAATYILMAGKNSRMSKNSWFMIHNVSGFAWGEVNEVERMANTLRQFNNRIRDFYAEETGLRKEDITKMMNEETWMTADQAKEKNFIKVIDGEAKFENMIDKSKWNFSNMAVLNAYNSSVNNSPKPEDPDTDSSKIFDNMKKFFQDMGNSIMNAIKNITAPANNDHAALMTSIGTAVQNAMNAAAESVDNVVNESVANAATAHIDLTKDGPFKTAFNSLVSSAVANAVDFTKDGAAKTALTNAVEAATKELTTKVTNLETAKDELEKKNKALEQEIVNIKGKATNAKDKQPEDKKPVGNWE